MAAGSPGGVEEGRVSIRVVPDTASFAADLRALLTRITEQVQLTVKANLDTTGLAEKVDVAVKEIQAETPGINIATKVDTSQLAPLEQGLANIGGESSSIGSSMGFWQVAILAAVTAVAVLGPALAVLLPVIAGVGLAVGAIALTLNGLKKVFAPLINGIKSLTKPLTKTITQGLKPFVKSFTASFIPVLKTGLTAAAEILNQVAKAFLSLGKDSSFMKTLAAFMTDAGLAFRPLVNVIPLVAKAFVQIGEAAIPALLALTKGFAGVLINFSNAIARLAASGQLTKIINNAASALSALLGATTSILGQLLRLGSLLAPAFTAVFNAVGPLAKIVETQLVGAFKTLEPVVQQVFNFFAQNRTALIGVSVALLALVAPTTLVAAGLVVLLANFQKVQPFLVSGFAAITKAVQPMIDAFTGVVASARNLATTLTPIVEQIVAIFVQNWPQIRAIVVQVFSTIQSIVVAVLTDLKVQIQAATEIISFVWAHFGAQILGTIKTVLPAILATISGVLNVIQGIFRLFTAVLNGDWSAAWAAIKQIASGAIKTIQGSISEGLAVLKGLAAIAIHAFVLAFSGLGKAVLAQIGDIGSSFEQLGKDIVDGIAKGVTNAAAGVADAVKGAVAGALSDAKSFLKINSPSKLYAREVGSPISEGIAAGVTDAASMVSGAVVKAVKPPNIAGGPGTATTAGNGGPAVLFTGPVGFTIDDLDKKITQSQRDAATVANLRLALVG